MAEQKTFTNPLCPNPISLHKEPRKRIKNNNHGSLGNETAGESSTARTATDSLQDNDSSEAEQKDIKDTIVDSLDNNDSSEAEQKDIEDTVVDNLHNNDGSMQSGSRAGSEAEQEDTEDTISVDSLQHNDSSEAEQEDTEDTSSVDSLQDNHSSIQRGSRSGSGAEQEGTTSDSLQDNHSTQSGSPPDSEFVPRSVPENTTLDHLASEAYAKITKGFKIMRRLMKKKPKSQPLAISTHGVNAQTHENTRELVIHGAPELLRQAEAVAGAGQLQSWYLKYLAGAILLYYRSLPLSSSGDFPEWNPRTEKILNRWAIIADLVNPIVEGLHSKWGNKTYSVFGGLACKSPWSKSHTHWI